MRTLFAIVGVSVALLLGCSTDARQRLARFFFEVPDPPVTQPVDAKPSAPLHQSSPTAVEPAHASVHPPFVEQQCTKCHDAARQMGVRDNFPAVCRACHAHYFSKEVEHSPVADGQCTTCHEPHNSRYAFLLKASTLEVCTECHDAPASLSAPAHGGPGAERCAECHDPHFGTAPFLKTKREVAPPATAPPVTPP